MKSKSLFLLLLSFLIVNVSAQRDFSDSDTTKLVILGSGTPIPSPLQSGCSLAIIVFDTSYIIDFGPGQVRKAAALSPTYGGNIEGFYPSNIRYAFLTHLHPDHTTCYPDLILTPMTAREKPLEVYGPVGLTQMTEYILKVYGQTNNQESIVNTHEFTEEGIIYLYPL